MFIIDCDLHWNISWIRLALFECRLLEDLLKILNWQTAQQTHGADAGRCHFSCFLSETFVWIHPGMFLTFLFVYLFLYLHICVQVRSQHLYLSICISMTYPIPINWSAQVTTPTMLIAPCSLGWLGMTTLDVSGWTHLQVDIRHWFSVGLPSCCKQLNTTSSRLATSETCRQENARPWADIAIPSIQDSP